MARKSDALAVVKDMPTLRELTTDKLRKAIVSLHFKPNQHLIERELCEQTGVSRTCVREALRLLEAEGLIERRQNRGLYVAGLSIDEAREVYEVRAALEPSMARLFTERAGDKDLRALTQAFGELERAAAGSRLRAYVDGYAHFYDVLLAGSGNELAHRILRTLWARITYLRSITAQRSEPAYRKETVAMMRGILQAALRRDGRDISRRCEAFVLRSAEFAYRVLAAEQHVEVQPDKADVS